MDVYPDVASKRVSDILKILEVIMDMFFIELRDC